MYHPHLSHHVRSFAAFMPKLVYSNSHFYTTFSILMMTDVSKRVNKFILNCELATLFYFESNIVRNMERSINN